MKYILLLICFQCLYSQKIAPEEEFTVSQNYIYLAKYKFYKKDYKKASDLFKKAFYYHSPLNSYDLLDAAACSLYNGENALSEQYITEAIVNYKAPLDFIMEYNKFKPFLKNVFFKELPSKYETYFNKFYGSKKNLQAYLDVNVLVEKDQFIRNIIDDFEKNKIKTKTDTLLIKQLNKTDNENVKELIEITNKFGYLDSSWLLLWHQRPLYNDSNSFFWNFFKPLINKEIKEGKVHKSFFAMFEDFNETINNQRQKYGVFPQYFGLYPFEDIKNIDTQRGNIGLPPLSFEIIVNGYPIPEKYQFSETGLEKQLEERILKYEK